MKQRSEVGSRKTGVAWMRLVVLILSILVASQALAQDKGNIILLIGVANSYKAGRAIAEVLEIPLSGRAL